MTITPQPVTATFDGANLTTYAEVRSAVAAHNKGEPGLVLWSLAVADHGRTVEELPAEGVDVQTPGIGEAGTAELVGVATIVQGVTGWKVASSSSS